MLDNIIYEQFNYCVSDGAVVCDKGKQFGVLLMVTGQSGIGFLTFHIWMEGELYYAKL